MIPIIIMTTIISIGYFIKNPLELYITSLLPLTDLRCSDISQYMSQQSKYLDIMNKIEEIYFDHKEINKLELFNILIKLKMSVFFNKKYISEYRELVDEIFNKDSLYEKILKEDCLDEEYKKFREVLRKFVSTFGDPEY
jgi:hypothetical protein